MNKSDTDNMLGAVFDALPSIIFVVDQDVSIQEYNAAASDLLSADRKTILNRRAGEIMHCIHSHEDQEGCGRAPSCRDCIIRNSVTEAFEGNRIVRRRARIELVRDASRIEIYALITASPFSFRSRPLVLLVIEDISELAELYRMIHICAICKKVNDDMESWMRLEAYFKNNWDVDFSHGLCPECLKYEMDKLELINKEIIG